MFAHMPDSTLVQMKLGDLRQLVKEMSRPAPQWVTTAEFKKLTGKTEHQVRYLRDTHPTWFKLNDDQTRWLVDTKKAL